ncbi:hypothetical protein [Mycoplasma phocimorsus]|uniref:hypothetical protein n=1 Tax=Mycoplasma phocimorsus TaxID=3045839 RepID=UPI0024C077D4|nr:hypothetical protein [Mycoplasma phocimorsus]MDJ1646654.1 hypothetical protein [Mycoplasma phocimorsus]
MQKTILDSHFVSGSHASNNVNTIRSKTSVSISNSETASVWGLLWKEVKSWWNNWLGTAFYSLIGVGATIGISYSAYTSYWKNKRNFKLKNGENLKITLELHPNNGDNNDHWYGRFYNDGSSIDVECSCQRKFKKNSSNNLLSVTYVLTNILKKPGLLLYSLDKEGKEGKTISETDWFPIVDYYPGYNTVSIYKYKSKKEKIGNLVIKREIITDEQLCKMCKEIINCTQCECKSSSCITANGVNKCCVAIEKKKCCICKNKQDKLKCECKALCCKNCDEKLKIAKI